MRAGANVRAFAFASSAEDVGLGGHSLFAACWQRRSDPATRALLGCLCATFTCRRAFVTSWNACVSLGVRSHCVGALSTSKHSLPTCEPEATRHIIGTLPGLHRG
eukprot:6173658-Pleurochrysis_carterae.AAC.4